MLKFYFADQKTDLGRIKGTSRNRLYQEPSFKNLTARTRFKNLCYF